MSSSAKTTRERALRDPNSSVMKRLQHEETFSNVPQTTYSTPVMPAKVLKVNSVWLLARCIDAGAYAVTMTPPAPGAFPNGATKLTLAPLRRYGNVVLPT
jgi:hypothetical protein